MESEHPTSKEELDRRFSELYREHLRDVYSYSFYRVGNHHDAEDLTEQTFLQAYRHFERALRESDGRPLRPWLIRIAHNLAANFYRDRSRKPESAIEDAGMISTPHTTESLVEGREELKEHHRGRAAAPRRPPRGADHALRARHGQPRDRPRAGALGRRHQGAAAPRDPPARGDRRIDATTTWGAAMSANVEALLREALTPVEPPVRLAEQLESKLTMLDRGGAGGARQLGARGDARPAQLGAAAGRRRGHRHRRARRSSRCACATASRPAASRARR